MEEKKVEEILQDEEIPVTEEASGEGEAVQAQDAEVPETETAESDTEAGEACAEETEEAESEADSDENNTDGEKKGFFSKLKKGDKEKAAMEEKIAGLEDRVKRQMAEFENFRKRTEKEKQTMFSMGERSVIEKMLPIVDNFERGLAAVPENEKDTPLASGMEMVYRQLVKQLEDLGVTPIEAVGQEFDPNFHNAVMQVESEEYPSGTVAQEFQKGYKYHDAVIRYSMVGVVQ
ncbi:MAG: nucleotide exchange factor GrpE [Lachnospiraceae bacterium]|jgi:molecular chaperone GrpE|nr:nucleotide exchange factor GrpE [Lachnospiraceae bacterium]